MPKSSMFVEERSERSERLPKLKDWNCVPKVSVETEDLVSRGVPTSLEGGSTETSRLFFGLSLFWRVSRHLRGISRVCAFFMTFALSSRNKRDNWSRYPGQILPALKHCIHA